MYATLPLKAVNRRANLAARQLLHGLLSAPDRAAAESRPARCLHPGFLKLRERTSCFDRLVLPRVADQQNSVIRMKPYRQTRASGVWRRAKIRRARRASFRRCPAVLPGEMPLQRRSFDSGLGQLLRSTGRGRKSFDSVALGLSAFANDGQRRCLACSGDSIRPNDLLARQEKSHRPLGAARRSTPGAGPRSQCAAAARPASDRHSRDDCRSASGQ